MVVMSTIKEDGTVMMWYFSKWYMHILIQEVVTITDENYLWWKEIVTMELVDTDYRIHIVIIRHLYLNI